jgi:hypothetical protein
MKRYQLVRRALNCSCSVNLTEKEYDDILDARRKLLLSLYIEENFDLLLNNYLEFETNLVEMAARMMVKQTTKYAGFQAERRLINRLLINLLTASRTYLDQTPHHISDIFGKESEVFNDVDKEISYKYEKYLGYRVMDTLRNHVQHRGSPIHSVTYESRWVGERPTGRLLHLYIPKLTTKYLQEDDKIKKATLKEIESLGNEIDIRPFIRQYIQALVEVNGKIREILRPHINTWEQIIRGAIRQYQNKCPDEKTVLGLTLAIYNDDDALESVDIFDELIEYRQQLEKENAGITNLPASYITNEV